MTAVNYVRMSPGAAVSAVPSHLASSVSQAIPYSYVAGLYQFVMSCHFGCGIACEIEGGARYWVEVGFWCVTFFALLGLVVVEAVQNSPCWRNMRRKEVFRACRESFVPGGPAKAACRESFVPGGPAKAACRESFVPGGWPVGQVRWRAGRIPVLGVRVCPGPTSRARTGTYI